MTEADLFADLVALADHDLITFDVGDTGPRVDLTANGHAFLVASCDHVFLSGGSCVNCGWTPTAGPLVTGAGHAMTWVIRVTYVSGHEAYLREGYQADTPIVSFPSKLRAEQRADTLRAGVDQGVIVTVVEHPEGRTT
jgi:hypothetical protein